MEKGSPKARAVMLRTLITEEYEGSHQRFSERTGHSLSQIGQWLSGNRNMKSDTARLLERKCNKPSGWLDGYLPADLPNRQISRALSNSPDAVSVPVLNASASMGVGDLLPEHDVIVGGLTLDRNWIRRNLSVSSLDNLSVITGYGNSMEPTFRDGDLLLVDRGITSVTIDGIYVFEQGMNGERMGYIKTLQRRPEGVLRAISDNKTYDAWDIPRDAEFRVLGRVVWAWNGKKL